jgi:hypothetical protein
MKFALIFTFLILIQNLNLFGQGKSIYIEIEGVSETFGSDTILCSVANYHDSTIVFSGEFPNQIDYALGIIKNRAFGKLNIPDTSYKLKVYFSNNEDFIFLDNIYEIKKDTLKISMLNELNNQQCDSVFKKEYTSKNKNNNRKLLKSSEIRKLVDKECVSSKKSSYTLTLNSIKYELPVKTYKVSTMVKTGSGQQRIGIKKIRGLSFETSRRYESEEYWFSYSFFVPINIHAL